MPRPGSTACWALPLRWPATCGVRGVVALTMCEYNNNPNGCITFGAHSQSACEPRSGQPGHPCLPVPYADSVQNRETHTMRVRTNGACNEILPMSTPQALSPKPETVAPAPWSVKHMQSVSYRKNCQTNPALSVTVATYRCAVSCREGCLQTNSVPSRRPRPSPVWTA